MRNNRLMITAVAGIAFAGLSGCASLQNTWNKMNTGEKVFLVGGTLVGAGAGHALAAAGSSGGRAAATVAGAVVGEKATEKAMGK